MMQISVANDFAGWRAAARKCLQKNIAPDEILWTNETQNCLFENDLAGENSAPVFKVPKDFLALGEAVACYDAAQKWSLLYRILFRLIYENKNLLHIESDDDVRRARLMEKAVARDVHKFHAFVRFRRIECDGAEIFVAWHEPQHFTVARATPFFARRFGALRFLILTPKGCAEWDLQKLIFTAGASSESAPREDATEDFWLAYYQSIFNPYRLKIKAMKAELPVRHWRTLPEARLIPQLIRQARKLNDEKL